MRKQLAFLLAFITIFGAGLTGCAKKTDSSSSAAETVTVADDYVEDKPLDNELIHELPIPPETGTLPLEEQVFDEQGMSFQVPPGVTAEQSDDSVVFTDNGGKWVLSFTPFTQGGFYERCFAADHGMGDSRKYREADRCDTQIKGFDCFVSAANTTAAGRSAAEDERIPEYNIVMDYGSEYVGKWAGVQITLRPTKFDASTNIYEYLYLRHVRSLLNGFEPVRSRGGTLSAGGITAALPERWTPAADTANGALTAHIVNGKERGGLLITSVSASDAAAYAKARAGENEVFTKTYGSTVFSGFVKTIKSPSLNENDESVKTETLIAELYSDMGGGRAVRTVVCIRGADSERLSAFLESEVFTDVMASVTADSSGAAAGAASVSGFTCGSDGVITAYSGSIEDLTIPSEINGVAVTAIGSGAFKGSKVKSVTLPAGITEIGSKAFSGCKKLEEIRLSEGLISIDSSAFSGCKSLNSVTLPATVCYVGSEAFSETGSASFSCLGEPKFDSKALAWSGYKTIDISGGDLSAVNVMNGCAAESITLGEGVERIGRDCMSGCPSLSSVTLPNGLKKLGKYCMADDPSLHSITIPKRLELIPEGCFSDTRLDTLILPENITGMEHYAVTSAGYLAIMNPDIKLAMEAFNVERVYLSGVHLSQEVPRGLEYQYVAYQVYLAMDSLPNESSAMDDYLNGIGFGEIAWIGTDPDFLPADNKLYTVGEDYDITACTDKSDCLYIPHFSFGIEENREIYAVNKNVFTGSPYKEIYINSNLEKLPANAFAESADLTDLWFSGAVSYQMSIEGFMAGCFYGLPDDITVHLPARIEEADRAALEETLHNKGIPASAVFDYYTL